MTEEVIIKVGTTGDGSVDTLNKKLVETGKNASKAESEISKLRKELRDAKGDMLKYAEGTEQYNRALRRASDIQGRMKETNDIVKAGVRDLGATTKLVAGTIGGLASGFQVAQGAMALFGVENDAVLKTMMQMQAVMSITQGIAGFADGFDNLQDLMAGFRAQSEGAKDAVGELNKVSGEAAGNMSNVAKEGAVIGSNLVGTAGVVDGVNTKFKSITETLNNFTKSQIDADIALIKSGKDFDSLSFSSNKYLATLGENINEEDILLEKLQEKSDSLKKVENNTDKVTKSTDKATNSLKSQLLTMGLWIAAIAVATFAITSLIEWMNKVPEDLKVKIDVETDVFKALEKDLININKFVNDYRKASKDGNKERLAELEKFGKKEYDLNDTRLKQIRDTTDGWKSAFKEYLKIAEDTYWNESIIKRKVEAQQAAITAKSTAIQLFKSQSDTGFMSGKTAQGGLSAKTSGGWTWEQLVVAAQKNDWAGKTDADLRAFGIPQQIIDELRKVILSNEIIKGLPKLRDVDLKTGVVKETKQPKEKLEKSLGLDVIKEEADRIARESFTKPILDGEIKYTNEEIVIMNDNNKKRKGLWYDSINEQSKYIKDRENARQKDLNNQLTYEYGQKLLLQEETTRFDTISSEYDTVIADLNSYNKNRVNLLNTNALIEKQISESKNQKYIEGLNKQKTINLEAIKLIESYIAAKQLQKTTLEAQLKEFEGNPEKMKQITESIAKLNVAMTDSMRAQVEEERNLWQERMIMAKDYLDAVSDVFGGLADLSAANMDVINADFDRQQWNIEETVANEESKNKQLEALDMKRWQALQKDFENQKNWKIAQAIVDLASGSVGIWTSPQNIALGPVGYPIMAGLQEAALVATTMANIKSIKSQQMLKPHKGGSGSSGGSSSANIALNPAKDALTSRDENLNTMAKANQKDAPTNVVKVSEINDVQSRVKVREENASY